MPKRNAATIWARQLGRTLGSIGRATWTVQQRAARDATKTVLKKVAEHRTPPPGEGDWIAGVAMGPGGARRFRLYRPPGIRHDEQVPLLVMLHGCTQDAKAFAAITRMNRIAARERFLVLYPEQDRVANPQGCWHWYDLHGGRAHAESVLILKAIDQVRRLYPVDPKRVALAGLSAGASMAALLATRHPERFRAVVMHSGIPPGLARSGASALGAMQGLRAARGPAPVASPMHPAPPEGWPPLLVIHGGRDGIVSVHNGHAAVQAWAEAVGARPMPVRQVQRGRRHPMQVTEYRRGRTAVATLVEVPALAHAWSGGAAKHDHSDPEGPDASRLTWRFVARAFDA